VEPEQIFPYPDVLDADRKETLSMLVDMAERTMVEHNDPARNEELGRVPEETIQRMRDGGAFGLQVPEEYGGINLNYTEIARMSEILGANDLGVGVFMAGHQSIGYKGILVCGTDEQKAKYLPALAAGDKMAAFALTEPGSGSDAGSIKTRAELSSDGKHYLLNGSKLWITNGAFADVMTVFAKTPVTDQATGTVKEKMTAFIVERSFGGISNSKADAKMGILCTESVELFFENTPVPVENVLGGVGNGFKVAMAILNNGRFGMGASLSGTMKTVIQKATEHATQRVQFGSRIDSYGAIQEKLARMSMLHYATESMAYMVSGTMDRGYEDFHVEAAISKIFASEAAWNVTDEGIQILGGNGYMKSLGLEKVMRDLRIFRIFEGTNDILRLFVGLMGIQYAGGHLQELQAAIKDPVSNFGLLMGEASKRAKGGLGIGGANQLTDQVHPNLMSYGAMVSTSTQMFGAAVEKLLVKHGKNIIHEQFLLNRVANSAIDIYAMTCVLSRCTKSLNEGLESAHHEEMMTKVWCREAFGRIQSNVNALNSTNSLNNFKVMASISKGVSDRVGVVQGNPLGV